MPVVTAHDLIQDALEMLGVGSPGETNAASDENRCLIILNGLLDELAAEQVFVNSETEVTTSLTISKAVYTVGLNGADIAAPRPQTIAYGESAAAVSSPGLGIDYEVNDTGTITVGSANATYIITAIAPGGAVAGFRLTNPGTAYATNAAATTATGGPQPGDGTGLLISITAGGGPITASALVGSVIGAPVQVVSMIEFQSLAAYAPSPGQPNTLYFKPAFPLAIVNLLPAPSSILNLTFLAWARIVSFPTLTTGYSLAAGVFDALRQNLAMSAKTYFRDAQIDPLIMQAATVSRAFLRFQSINSRAMLDRFQLPTNPAKPT